MRGRGWRSDKERQIVRVQAPADSPEPRALRRGLGVGGVEFIDALPVPANLQSGQP